MYNCKPVDPHPPSYSREHDEDVKYSETKSPKEEKPTLLEKLKEQIFG